MSSPENYAPSRQSISPAESNNTEGGYIVEDESFSWLHLVQARSSPEEWIQSFQGSRPLQMLLSAAMDACAKQIADTDDTIDLPPPYQTLVADVRLMQALLQHMERLHRQAASAHATLLDKGLTVVESIRASSTLHARISAEEVEIALLEKSIAREELALSLTRNSRLERQLARDQRQLVEWKALSSILADIDFPREDDTSPTGLAYGFTVAQLACEIVLRPAADGTLDSATLDVMEESGTAGEGLPTELIQMFRDLLSNKLSCILEEDLDERDFQQAARQVVVFLGRLDRVLDDLAVACQQWDHEVLVDETATSLQVNIAPDTSICLNWQVSSAFVLEYAYPSQVNLLQDLSSKSLEADHPPSLRALWKQVVGVAGMETIE